MGQRKSAKLQSVIEKKEFSEPRIPFASDEVAIGPAPDRQKVFRRNEGFERRSNKKRMLLRLLSSGFCPAEPDMFSCRARSGGSYSRDDRSVISIFP
jgi:hypothetical protein